MNNKKHFKKLIKVNSNRLAEKTKQPIKNLINVKNEIQLLPRNRMIKKVKEINTDEEFAKAVQKLSKSKNFAVNAKDIANSIPDLYQFAKTYAEQLEQIIDSNERTTDKTLDILGKTNDGLLKYLEVKGDNLTPEERKDVLINIMEINKMIVDTNKENKEFLNHLKKAGGIVAAIALLALGAMINGSSNDKN